MKQRLGKLDFAILTVTILLTLFGLVMVFSASYYEAQERKDGVGLFYLNKQLLGAAIGLVALVVASYVSYRVYNRPIIPYTLVGISIVLLIVVLFVKSKNNVNRFLNIGGFSFQPSEIGRLAVVFFLAWWTPRHGDKMRSDRLKVVFREGLMIPLLVAGSISGLILVGRNLSMAVSTLMIALIMLMVAGVRWKPLLILIGATAAFGIIFTVTESYRMTRMIVFMDPWKYIGNDKDEGYQLVQSLYALGNGGIFGVGLGNSRQKLLYLPYMYSDFILSIIGEELGFLGMGALVLAFWVLLWRGMLVAVKAVDEYGMMLATGITALIGVQFLINLLVVTSTMPPTGVPLPFISAGNTSLIVFMAAVGVLLNVSRFQTKT